MRESVASREARLERCDLRATWMRFSRSSLRENVSVNLLINKALTRYVEWDANSEKFGLVSVSKRLLRALFDGLSEKDARSLGTRSGREGGPEMITFFYKKFDLETLLSAFEN